MHHQHRTHASRTAAALTAVLAVLLATRALQADSLALALLQTTTLLAAAAGAVKMWLHNCFESRLTVVLAVSATLAGNLLTITIGTPGETVAHPTPTRLTLLALSTTIALLLLHDTRTRRTHRSPRPSTYAL